MLEVGPGLGSLTLGLLDTGARVVAVEVDPRLAAALPDTIRQRAPGLANDSKVIARDARTLSTPLDPPPTALVANLPYNVAVPVLLHLLELLPSIQAWPRVVAGRGRGSAGCAAGRPGVRRRRPSRRPGTRRRNARALFHARSSGRCRTSTRASCGWCEPSRRRCPQKSTVRTSSRSSTLRLPSGARCFASALAAWAGSATAADLSGARAGRSTRPRRDARRGRVRRIASLVPDGTQIPLLGDGRA